MHALELLSHMSRRRFGNSAFAAAALLLASSLLAANNALSAPAAENLGLASYDLDQAITLANYAQTAYCADEDVMGWNCTLCRRQTQLKPLAILRNDSTDTHGWVGVDTRANHIVISFRGTKDLQNWITDLDGFEKASLSLPFCDVPGHGAAIHIGFYIAYMSVQQQMLTALQSATQQYPSYPVVVTGHSLGAALAVLAALDIGCDAGPGRTPRDHVAVYNYGSPRLGNPEFASTVIATPKVTLFRHTHWKDVIPHLPPDEILGYHHAATEMFLQEDWDGHTYTVCDGSGEDPKCSDQFDYPDSVDDHLSYFGLTMESTNCGA